MSKEMDPSVRQPPERQEEAANICRSSRTPDHGDADRRAQIVAEFSDFFRLAQPRLVAHLIARGLPSSDAMDSAQEALILAYKSWTQITTNPYAWTRTTAWRTYLKRLRQVELPLGDIDDVPHLHGNEIDEVIVQHRIVYLLSKLPPRQRAVIALTFDEATPKEISVELGVTVDQVRSNFYLARRTLRALLSDTECKSNGDVE